VKHLTKTPQLSFVALSKVLTLLQQNTQDTAVGSHNSETGHLSGTNAKMLRLQDLMCLRSFRLNNTGASSILFIMRNTIHQPLIIHLDFGTRQSFSTPERPQMKKS